MPSCDELTDSVKEMARGRGFDRIGIAPAGALPHTEAFHTWLARGHHAGLTYMARNVEKRLRPDALMPGAKSVICMVVSCAGAKGASQPAGLVGRYAHGRDYHKVLKRRCSQLMDSIRRVAPSFEGRAFVDTAPLTERSLAALAGVGWIGRNGCLIVPGLGSYVLLCEIVCNLPLRLDKPMSSQCRQCGQCVEACPTGAILDGGMVDAGKCVSYLTIEHRGAIDPALWPRIGERLFGCDRCQEACPFNMCIPPGDPEFQGAPLGGASLGDILGWERAEWDVATRGSATRRARWEMMIRNAVIAAGNSSDTALAGPLQELAEKHPEFREMVDWAAGRLDRA